MDDEADRMSNLCTNLVSMKRYEPALKHLLNETPGGWIPVRELYRAAGADAADADSLLAAWLPSPNNRDYVVIVFLDDETKWSQTADYHATRLLGRQASVPVSVAS